MRKPNLAEAVEQFTHLMSAFKRDKNVHYSVFCSLATARCEQAMNNDSTQEAGYYFVSGSVLWETCERSHNDGTEGIEEDITEAINCYLLAIKIYLNHQRGALAGHLYGEMGHALYALGYPILAGEYICQAAYLRQTDSPLVSIQLWIDGASCRISTKDYKSAIECYNNMIRILSDLAFDYSNRLASSPPPVTVTPSSSSLDLSSLSASSFRLGGPIAISVYTNLLVESRITLILLLLLQDSFLSAKDHIGKLLMDDLASAETSDEVVSLLQALVMVCERREILGLRTLQRELCYGGSGSLNALQSSLLDRLVSAYHEQK